MSSETYGDERRLALVIGVNEAPQSHLGPLNYALNDAESMAQTLQEHCGFTLLQPPLLGSDATSANVKKAVLALARHRTDNDFLLLYFSGHGQPMTISGDQSDIYLVTSDFSERDTEEDENLHCSMRWLQEKLYIPTQAGKVLLVLDCCYAGNMGRTAPDPYLEDLKMRINRYFDAPGTASGARAGGLRSALTATSHNQPASEQEGHGVMTGPLLECLQGNIDDVIDLDDHGNVSLYRLYEYLHRVMPEDQKPSVSGDSAGQNCVLANYEQRATELRQRKRGIVNEIPRSYIPLARITSFQLRPGEFDEIARLLFADEGGKVSHQSRVVGLIGMGGIGKTRLAVEIAYEYKERFPAGVFWMAATGTSLPEWQHQFAELAANTEYLPSGDDASHPENEARRARHITRYLAHHPDALLLLDNVEHIEHLLDALTRFAGEEVHCTILYTSRTDMTPIYVKKYPVGRLPEIGALHLLLEKRPAALEQSLSDADDQETRAARDICRYIDGLPLALILLRDLLQDIHLTLPYLYQQLRQRGALDITREQDVTDARLFSTFLLSWQKVRNPDAQRLFKLASFFPEATPIPLWLLALTANLEGNTSIEPLGKARLDLVRWSLIEELPGDTLRLHPITREFARYLVGQDNERDALLAAAQEQLTNEFIDVYKLEQRVLAEGYWRCLEHVHEAVNYAQRLGIKQANLLERVEYWLARDSSLLGASPLWPEVLPGLFYQQLHNRALEEGYELSGIEPDARWVRQLSRVGAEDQLLLREFRHPHGVTCVAFAPDGSFVATGCEDCSVRIWDAGNGQMMQRLQRHDSPITGVAFSPNGSMLVTCAFDTDVFLWNVLNGQFIRTFHGHESGVHTVVFSPDGKYVATRSDDKTVRVWDVTTGEMTALFVSDSEEMKGLAFFPDSKLVAISDSNEIAIWDRESERIVATLRPDVDGINALEANLAERYNGDEKIGYVDIRSGEVFEKYPNIEQMQPMSITFSPDGQFVLAASYQNVYTWDITQHDLSHPTLESYFPYDTVYDVSGTAFSSDGKLVALIRYAKVMVFEVAPMHMLLICSHTASVASVAYTLDGSKVVTGSSDGIARIWRIPAEPPKIMFVEAYDERIEYTALSSSGKKFMVITIRDKEKYGDDENGNALIQTYDVVDGSTLGLFQSVFPEYDYSVAFSPDGERIAYGRGHHIHIYNMKEYHEEEEAILFIPSEKSRIHCIVFSPTGTKIAFAKYNEVRVWNLDTQKEIALLEGHEGDIEQLVFSSDATRLVIGSTDATARIWNISSGAQLAVLKEYAGRCICISPDGRMVAIGLFSNAIYVASMEDGKGFMILEGHTQPVTILSFSPSGRSLMSVDQSSQILFWHVDVDGQRTMNPTGIYIAANEIAAAHWQDEQHVVMVGLNRQLNRPHFYHLALEGIWCGWV